MLKSRERSLNVQGIEQITYNYSSRFIYNGAGLGRIFDFHKNNFYEVKILLQWRRFKKVVLTSKITAKINFASGNLCFTPVEKYHYSE